MYTTHACQAFSGAENLHRVSWSSSYRTALWVMGTEPTSSAGAMGVLNPPNHLFSPNMDL